MSGTADSSANPLFRRLGVTGGGITHFNGGRFGNASEPVSRDVLKLFAMALREVSAKVVEVDCSDKVSIKGKKTSGPTSERQDCTICGKKHAGRAAACWQRPGGKNDPAKKTDSAPQPSKRKALRAELRALAELLQEEGSEIESSGGTDGSSDESDVEGSNKDDDEYFVFLSHQTVTGPPP